MLNKNDLMLVTMIMEIWPISMA